MRTRVLGLIAGAAALLGTALVALPTTTATALDHPLWTLCSSPSQVNCIESAKANGASVLPGPTATAGRDFPWFKGDGAEHFLVFGAYHDVTGSGTNETYDVDPGTVFTLVVRTGSFRPREMHAIAKNGDFSVDGSAGAGWKATIQFQATSIHHTNESCTYDGGCDDTIKADTDYSRITTGSIEDLVGSGLSAREIYARQGMFTVTNAQDSYPFYDFDTGTLEIRMANPHLDKNGVPVTDGTYDALIPDAYLTSVMGVPDPSVLTTGSFLVTKTVGGATTSAPYTITKEPNGIRIKITNISFSRPKYKIRVKPSAPGKPRPYRVVKVSKHAAKVKFSAPVANGRARIDKYQARCHKVGKAWHFKTGKGSPLVVTGLPTGKVSCQVRAHNAKGWGRFSAALRS